MQERTSRLPFFPDWLGQMETCWIILWCNMLGFFLRQAAGWAVAKASMANPSQRYLPNGARAQHRGTFLGSRLRRQPMDLLTCSDGPRQGADVWAKWSLTDQNTLGVGMVQHNAALLPGASSVGPCSHGKVDVWYSTIYGAKAIIQPSRSLHDQQHKHYTSNITIFARCQYHSSTNPISFAWFCASGVASRRPPCSSVLAWEGL